jgi:3-hydroxyacyl-[acyl-carrier-protein] dehydratase
VTRSVLNIAADHPVYAGHFVNFPVLPGAVLLDEALFVIEHALSLKPSQWRIASAKFLAAVRPGDELWVEHHAPANGVIRFSIGVKGSNVVSGVLALAANS